MTATVHGVQFEHAIEAALHDLSIKASIVAPEHLDGHKIVRRENPDGTTDFHVIDENAWINPHDHSLVLKEAPTGDVVATVTTKGDVVYA